MLLLVELNKRVEAGAVLPKEDHDIARMLHDLAGNRAELFNNRAQANALRTMRLVMLQGRVDHYSLIANKAKRIESNG